MKPFVGAALTWCILTLLCLPSALAQGLTLDDAMSKVDELPVLKEIQTGAVKSFEAKANQAGRWEDPELEFEFVGLMDAETEVEARVNQAIPLNGEPGARRTALEHLSRAAHWSAEVKAQELKQDVADTFFEAVYRRQRLVVLQERLDAVQKTLKNLEQREAGGEASKFDVARLKQAVVRLTRAMEREAIEEEVARRTLGIFLNIETPAAVDGTLAVGTCGGSTQTTPAMKSLEAQAESAITEAEQTDKFWVPSLEVGAGYVGFDGEEAWGHGVILGLTLGLPLWRNGDFARDEHEGRHITLRSEVDLLKLRQKQAAETLSFTCQKMAENAQKLEVDLEGSKDIVRQAQAGYNAGEVGVLELLDAERGVLRDRLGLLEIEWRIRSVQNAWITNNGSWK